MPSTNSQYVRKAIHCQIYGKVNSNEPRLRCQGAKMKQLFYCPILTGTQTILAQLGDTYIVYSSIVISKQKTCGNGKVPKSCPGGKPSPYLKLHLLPQCFPSGNKGVRAHLYTTASTFATLLQERSRSGCVLPKWRPEYLIWKIKSWHTHANPGVGRSAARPLLQRPLQEIEQHLAKLLIT